MRNARLLLLNREWILPTRHVPARDLYVVAGGRHCVSPDYRIAHRPSPTCALAYVLSGKGALRRGRREHTAGPGTVLALFEGQNAYFCTDPRDLLRFLWVSFRGRAAAALLQRAGLTPAHPVLGGEGLAELRSHFTELHLLGSGGGPGVSCATLGKLWMIISILIDRHAARRAQPGADSPREFDLVARVARYLTDRLGESVTLEQVSREFHISRYALVRLFRREMGQSPIDYLIDERIRLAQRLLTEQDIGIAEAGRRVSYDDPAYFSRLFKRRCALSPQQFRQRR
ncbi:MAG: AraC family transcriptional regulator [Kiritimatiellae bacterium]|nr:AraC family transcriptional regulator [Kiritimatiellia bacterium]